jgi:hypothetical protein
MQAMSANTTRDISGTHLPRKLSSAGKFDLLTICSLAIMATVITDVIHEGLGHGGMCVATGGHPLELSTVHFECSVETRWVAAGGTIANLMFGALFWSLSRAVKHSARWRYFFWLLMTFNLFDAGGYFLFSGIGNIGDWASVVAGWQPAWIWRVALISLGAITYFVIFVPLCLRELLPFIGSEAQTRVRRARLLTLTPYLICGILSCVAGTLNPVGPVLILISAAAASFGGKSGLAWMWTLLQGTRIPSSDLQMAGLERSRGWIFAALLLGVLFIAGLGPGIKFR